MELLRESQLVADAIEIMNVSILVLMELLREWQDRRRGGCVSYRFNPCSNGITTRVLF